MTQKSLDYHVSKEHPWEFVRKIVEPGSIEDHKARLIAEKAEKEAASKAEAKQPEPTAPVPDPNSINQEPKKTGRPKKQGV